MIFVTVGTFRFDALIEEVDRLVTAGTLSGEVVCQIGQGVYEPAHARFFRFKDDLAEDFGRADLVICHGGATVLELMKRQQPFIAIANTALAEAHQAAFLRALGAQTDITWGTDPRQLATLLTAPRNTARTDQFTFLGDALETWLNTV